MPPFMAPYLLGLITAPLAKMIVKPLVRGTIKTTIGVAIQMKKIAAEAAEDLQDLAAEASMGVAAAEVEAPPVGAGVVPKVGTRVSVSAPKKP